MRLLNQRHEATLVYIGSFTSIIPQEVIRLEAQRNYTLVYQANGRQLLVSRTLKVVEEALQVHIPLLRISRKEAINLMHVQKHLEDGDLLLHDQSRVTPSRRKVKTVKWHLLRKQLYH
ncbi:LytTR family transcriptional regulator DNA-binding domain-containing protein [Telluribacter sp.]|jgi:two-component system LytT family response regulator|uniref:LytTR family transcriptional regulator DNA-binding domain-containing protein n=1 Tax=Telluribacter sp. TaxID=1978767 RepID=UPI002E111775|nr:LytTR family transcriptional regulator DNA-binding domain-containing protein [Telluribacter sp.]